MTWFWLIVAICFEVCGTLSLKSSDGLSKLLPSVLTFIFYGISFTALASTLKSMDVGIAYAVWAGAGTAIVALGGILFFGEAATLIKLAAITLIVLGVVVLNLYGNVH